MEIFVNQLESMKTDENMNKIAENFWIKIDDLKEENKISSGSDFTITESKENNFESNDEDQ